MMFRGEIISLIMLRTARGQKERTKSPQDEMFDFRYHRRELVTGRRNPGLVSLSAPSLTPVLVS